MKTQELQFDLSGGAGISAQARLDFITEKAIVLAELTGLAGTTPNISVDLRSSAGPIPMTGGNHAARSENNGTILAAATVDTVESGVVSSQIGPYVHISTTVNSGTLTGGTLSVTISGV